VAGCVRKCLAEDGPIERRSILGWRGFVFLGCVGAWLVGAPRGAFGQTRGVEACPQRPAAGSLVAEADEVRSVDGVLRVDLDYRDSVEASGQKRYCYLYEGRSEAPTLRVKPGDLVILRLKNDVNVAAQSGDGKSHRHSTAGACAGGEMPTAAAMGTTPTSPGTTTTAMNTTTLKDTTMAMGAFTNLHFHGLTLAPVCHEDDVLHTAIEAGGAAFEYRFRIPVDEAPGLYWYHPHIHGATNVQVLGGASGAIIVEGIERANAEVAGLPERLLIIRDQELVNPDAAPVQTDSMPPPMVMRDAEGDILNTGTGGGKPAKDLSINFVPVAFPNYVPAVVKIRPGEKELWRVLNASAITYLDLQMMVNGRPQMMGVVSLDGIPINSNGKTADGKAEEGKVGKAGNRILWQSHVLMPPAGRVEIIVKGPAEGVKASLVTRTVDTGPAGENDPTRPLATIVAAADAAEPRARLAASPEPLALPTLAWLGDVQPVRTRKLYFSEKPHDPKDPKSTTDFYLTVEGQEPKLFDPNDTAPNIVVQQGDVEDWIIENRTQELHAFHIHQAHFMLVEWNGVPLDEPFLRDTINVAYWDGKSGQYPSVKLRMDFRDPNIVGTFVYHCHLLEHEDGGMMGVIRVVAKGHGASSP
jgi:FtsP/CotA-like multicopper oxidase with cupredoxin domain